MRFVKSTLLSALLALGLASASAAATVNVTLDFKNDSNVSVANGGFSYDDSLNGSVIGFGDLISFNINMPNNTYDLAFLQSGSFSVFYGMAFNTATNSFNTISPGNFFMIFGVIKTGFSAGFFFAQLGNAAFGEYPGPQTGVYSTLQISSPVSAVPLPASLPLVLAGIGVLGAVGAKRKRKAA